MNFSSIFTNAVATSKFVDSIKSGTLTIDNSEFCTWNACFPMGLYNGALRRVSTRARSPLAFGAAVHTGLEAYFKHNPAWLQAAFDTAAKEDLDSMGDPKRNTQKLESLLTSYVLEYERRPEMQFKIMQLDNIPMVELPFAVPLGRFTIDTKLAGVTDLEIVWSGKIDLITEYNGMVAAVDHKTTSIMGEKFIDDKVRSSQMPGYTYAARYLTKPLGFSDVFGVRINALAMRTAGFEFKQFDIPYPDWVISEWQQETLMAIKRIVLHVDDFLATGLAVPTREHCVTKYGKCQYFDVCDTHPSMRDRMIFDDSYFFITNWSPLNE